MKILRPVSIAAALALIVWAPCVHGSEEAPASHTAGHPSAQQDLRNALLGWLEIPAAIIEVTNSTKNPLVGLTAGTIKGIVRAFPKTVSGAAATVTPGTSGPKQ